MYLPSITLVVFGALAASFALLLELLVASLSSVPIALEGKFSFMVLLVIVGIAIIEEMSKYIFLRQYVRRFFTHTNPTLQTSLILGALFGTGFAAIETAIAAAMPLPYSPLPFLATASIHITTSVAFAVFLLTSAAPRQSDAPAVRQHFPASWLIASAILLHTLYNLAIIFLF